MNNGMSQEPIESFLDDLLTRLPGSAREVRRTLAEAEQHLLESAEAFEAGGLGRLEAERAAVAAFGPPLTVAHGLARLRVRDLARPAVGLAAVGFLAIGLSGLLSEAIYRLWGATFLAGDLPGTSYTPARCADFQDYFPHHGCMVAAALHHSGEVVTYRLAAGVLGAVLLVSWRMMRPRRALPPGYLPLAGVVVFGGATAALAVETLNSSGGGWSGAGQWLSAALASAGVATVWAVRLRREVRPPTLTG